MPLSIETVENPHCSSLLGYSVSMGNGRVPNCSWKASILPRIRKILASMECPRRVGLRSSGGSANEDLSHPPKLQ